MQTSAKATSNISLRPKTMFSNMNSESENTTEANYTPQWAKDGDGFAAPSSSTTSTSTSDNSTTTRRRSKVLRYSKEELLGFHSPSNFDELSFPDHAMSIVVSKDSLVPVSTLPFDYEEIYKDWALNQRNNNGQRGGGGGGRGRGGGRGAGGSTEDVDLKKNNQAMGWEKVGSGGKHHSSTSSGSQPHHHQSASGGAHSISSQASRKYERNNRKDERDKKWERGVKVKKEEDLWDDVSSEQQEINGEMTLSDMAMAADKFREEMNLMYEQNKTELQDSSTIENNNGNEEDLWDMPDVKISNAGVSNEVVFIENKVETLEVTTSNTTATDAIKTMLFSNSSNSRDMAIVQQEEKSNTLATLLSEEEVTDTSSTHIDFVSNSSLSSFQEKQRISTSSSFSDMYTSSAWGSTLNSRESAPIENPIFSPTKLTPVPPPTVVDVWYYLDPQGNQQGPFKSSEMREWYEAGYFKPVLPIRNSHEGFFVPLATHFRDDAPFLLKQQIPNSQIQLQYKQQQEDMRKKEEAEKAALFKRQQQEAIAEQKRMEDVKKRHEEIQRQQLLHQQQQLLQQQQVLQNQQPSSTDFDIYQLRGSPTNSSNSSSMGMNVTPSSTSMKHNSWNVGINSMPTPSPVASDNTITKQAWLSNSNVVESDVINSRGPSQDSAAACLPAKSLREIQEEEQASLREKLVNTSNSDNIPLRKNKQNSSVSSPKKHSSTSDLADMGAQLKLMLGVGGSSINSQSSQNNSNSSISRSKNSANPSSSNSGFAWSSASASNPTQTKSLRDILAEEEKQKKTEQQLNLNNSVSNAPVASRWSNIVSGGTSNPQSYQHVPTSVQKQRRKSPQALAQTVVSEDDRKSSPQSNLPSSSTHGSTLPGDVQLWCSKQLKKMGRSDSDLASIEYCWSAADPVEIRETLAAYLGSTPTVSAFATEFIHRKKNARQNSKKMTQQPGSEVNSNKSEDDTIVSKKNRKRRGAKGQKP